MPRRKSDENYTPMQAAPSITPEGRDDELAALAYNLAEKKLREGTASNSLIESLMKNSSAKAKLEIEKLKRENELLVAKVKAIESAARLETAYREAMEAFKRYGGEDGEDDTNLY